MGRLTLHANPTPEISTREIRMKNQFVLLSCLILLSACSSTESTRPGNETAAALAYPQTPRIEHVDVYHGMRVADPYRWLEDAGAAQTKQWIDTQNALAQPYLESIAAREAIKKRLTQLWNYERSDLPVKRGGRYFY